jgi:hypothetical protein
MIVTCGESYGPSDPFLARADRDLRRRRDGDSGRGAAGRSDLGCAIPVWTTPAMAVAVNKRLTC